MNRAADLARHFAGFNPSTIREDVSRLLSPSRATPNLDWRAYYLKFQERHGDPVTLGGRLVFPDGWSYSSTDHAGPEWPPPEDAKELNSLLQDYWTRRLVLVKAEYLQLSYDLRLLKQIAETRDAPLQHVVSIADDNGAVRTQTMDLDFGLLETHVRHLGMDLERCQDELANLRQGETHAPAHQQAAPRRPQ